MRISTIIMAFVLLISTAILFIYMFVTKTKQGKDAPIDDSHWNNDRERLFTSVQRFISSKNEKILGILGSKFVEELLQKNASDNGFCVLTDKAYYFIGNIYYKKYVITRCTKMQRRINASEMKGIKVGAIYSNRLIICLAVMGLLAYGYYKVLKTFIIQLMLGTVDTEAEFPQVLLLCLVLGTLLLIIGIVYCIANLITTRRTKICLEFTSETISFPVSTLGKREIREFYKCISKVQNLYINVYPGNEDVKVTTPKTDKVGKLKELSLLYEQQLIGKEEFERLKKEIINEG